MRDVLNEVNHLPAKSITNIINTLNQLRINIISARMTYSNVGQVLEITDQYERKYYIGLDFDYNVKIVKADSIYGEVIYLAD